MATKHCDCRSKRPRSEANACPWHHAFIDDCMFAGLISFIGVASITRLVSRESHKRPPKVPHEPTRCYCCFLSLICNILLCTAQELVCGRSPAIVSSPRPPSRTRRTLRVAMRMVAQRPAMVHRVVRVVILMSSAPLMAALKAWGRQSNTQSSLSAARGLSRSWAIWVKNP